MRWIQMIISFLMKRATAGGDKPHPMEELKEFLKENAIKLVVGMVMIVTIGTLLTAGIYMTVASLTAQMDLGLSPQMTAMTWGGLIMALVPAVLLSFAWYKATHHDSHQKKKKVKQPQPPATLEQALVLLVTDFIEERQMKRELKFERERRMAEAEINAARDYQSQTETYQRH